MKPVPYLFFNGQCREAITTYAKIFGSEPSFMEAEEAPAADGAPLIMHAELPFGSGILMASDSFDGPSAPMDGCAISLHYDTAAEAKAIFDQLTDGAEITMPWAPTFWCAGFGMLRDRFGTRWMIGCEEAPA